MYDWYEQQNIDRTNYELHRIADDLDALRRSRTSTGDALAGLVLLVVAGWMIWVLIKVIAALVVALLVVAKDCLILLGHLIVWAYQSTKQLYANLLPVVIDSLDRLGELVASASQSVKRWYVSLSQIDWEQRFPNAFGWWHKFVQIFETWEKRLPGNPTRRHVGIIVGMLVFSSLWTIFLLMQLSIICG